VPESVSGSSLPPLGSLSLVPALERPDLLAEPVAKALAGWADTDQGTQSGRIGVVEIDPDLSDTAATVEAYTIPIEACFNCVVVSGRREGIERLAACVVRADTRADVNGLVRKALDVRKASFLPMERAVSETGMEYGGITPIGLPADWRVLVDSRLTQAPAALIGSGVRRSKLVLPGAVLAAAPWAEVISDLGR